MVRNLLRLLLLTILIPSVAETGQRILVVQSIQIPPYEEAVKGFTSVCHAKIDRLVISELRGADVSAKINDIKPHMVLAIGRDALSKVRRINNIPVVYLMVLNPQKILSGEKNITGVSMNISQEKQLGILSRALPGIKNVGLVYDPDKTHNLVKKAREASQKMGITLIAKEAHDFRDVPSLIIDMKGKIDAFWMLPDITVITPETTEFMVLFSLDNKIPILTFSEKYVALGAMMSIGIDAFDLGCQAGEKANTILSGNNFTDAREIEVRKAVVSISLKISEKLGLDIDKEIIAKAKVIDR